MHTAVTVSDDLICPGQDQAGPEQRVFLQPQLLQFRHGGKAAPRVLRLLRLVG